MLNTVRVLNAWSPSAMTRAIRLERPPGFTFAASQALGLILGEGLAHPMSIASGPARPYLDFAVQRTDSEFKRAFFALTPGNTVQITAPRGHFPLDRARPAVMIASGIGITPFRSMLEALTDENATPTGTILHATHSALDVPFRDEIDELARGASLSLLRRTGPFDEGELRSLASEVAKPIWYVAGPVEDVKQARELLGFIGVDKEDIRLEAFRYAGSLAAPAPGES